jgi:hypothetical protein
MEELCPPKKNPEYIKLEDAFGKGAAQIAFFRKGDNSIPTIEEAEKLLGVEAQYDKKRFEEFLKEQPYTIPTFAQTINEKSAKVLNYIRTNGNNFIQSMSPKYNDKLFEDGQIVAMKKNKGTEGMASKTISYITEARAKLNQENRIKDESAKKSMNFWNKEAYNNKIHFIIAMENPKLYDLKKFPSYQKFMKEYRTRMDNVYNILNSYKDLPYLQDYFPHFWEKPADVEKFFSNAYGGKNPLEGNKSFLKERFFADIKAGIDAGYRLITDNPEEIVRLAEMNAAKFKMGNDLFNICKEEGWTKFVRAGEKIPEGYSLVKDPIFQKMGVFAKKISAEEVAAAAEEGEAIKPEAGISIGSYYLPNEVAKIFNNDLSKGLAGIPIIKDVHKFITNFNNFKNSFQLGLSGFHGVGTSINAGIVSWSIGKGKILTGNPKNIVEGAKMMADGFTILPTVIKDYAAYKKVKADYLGGNSSVQVERLIMANMNPIAEKKWSINAEYNLKKSLYKLRRGDLKQGFNVAFHLATLPIELAAKPIMEYHVPRVKTMAYLKIVEHELSVRPGLTNSEIQLVCQRASASVDDLFGQVNYDNLFYDKAVKDIGFISIRSLGWTGGTIRAIGGGIADIPQSAIRTFKKGEGPTFRTNYLTGLITTTGLWGGMLYYMFNGKAPQKLQDYYIIPTGLKNPDGTELMISLPTFMKDAAAYTKDVVDRKYGRTLSKKVSPFISEATELMYNQDFFKQPVYDEEDEFYKKGVDILNYEFKSLFPFGFRDQPGPKQSFFSQQSFLSKIGLTKAPSEFTRTNLEEVINEQMLKELDKEKRGPGYDPEKSAYIKVLREQAQQGMSFDEMSLQDKQKAGLIDKSGKVIRSKVNKFMSTSRLTNAQRQFKSLSVEGQLKVITKLKKEDLDELLKNRRVLKTGPAFQKLKREKPEFFKNKELKDAYEMVTKRKFIEQEEDNQEKNSSMLDFLK